MYRFRLSILPRLARGLILSYDSCFQKLNAVWSPRPVGGGRCGGLPLQARHEFFVVVVYRHAAFPLLYMQ